MRYLGDMMCKVSALFVATDGIYFKLGSTGVDPWDAERDALKYDLDNPIVAHPPCSSWCKLAPINQKRWGHKIGDDGGCFQFALDTLHRCGGVLEHPAFSYAWPAFNLPKPERIGWSYDSKSGLWVCEVWQSAYGHLARKRTWLLYKGKRKPLEMRWDRKPGTHQCGHNKNAVRPKPVLSRKEASATPYQFAEALVSLARWSHG